MRKILVGVVVSVIVLPMATLGWKYIGEVFAAPKEILQIKEDQKVLREQTTQIGKWVEQREKEMELQKQAPPGWQWNDVTQSYIEWKTDPRLKRRK